VGTPYVWGGESRAEGGVDCSGLIIATYRDAGSPLSGRPIASAFASMGTGVSLADARPGDVVYYDKPGSTDHVGLYVGNGQMIDAPYDGARVRFDPVGQFTSIRRLIGGNSSVDNYAPDTSTSSSDTSTDTSSSDEGLLDRLNPFDDWADQGLELGLKLVATGIAGVLVIVGASRLVGSR
jgi:hypothetical protein